MKAIKPRDIVKYVHKKKLVFAEWMDKDGFHLLCLNNVPPNIVDSITRDAKLFPKKYSIFIE